MRLRMTGEVGQDPRIRQLIEGRQVQAARHSPKSYRGG
jgi:hypothetical protein